MNSRLAKELRVLLLPWSLAAAFALVIPAATFLVALHFVEGGYFINFLLGVVTFAFFGILLSLCALPFGIEFQHRTFSLLLSQPIPRFRIWRDKLVAALIAVVTSILLLALGYWITQFAANYRLRIDGGSVEGLNGPWEMASLAFALLLPTLGSISFWTLLARSTLAGMVFTTFSQLIVFGVIAFISEQQGMSPNGEPAFFGVIGGVYGVIFFLLSWRKFARLELSHVAPDAVPGSKSLAARPSRLAWLRCNPTSGLLNLIRKEIQLQRPLFIIAAILCVLWALAYIFLFLQPFHTSFSEIVFALTIGFYIPLISFLAGSVSLGEEKNLAIVGWHLTFPVSIRRQWAVKLAVGLGVWIILGLLLPFALIQLGMTIDHTRTTRGLELENWLGVSLFMTAAFALSFWAMTLFSNTVRAVIGSLVGVMAICGAVALAFWLLIEFVYALPVVHTLLLDDPGLDHQGWEVVGLILIGASTVVLALIQSLLQFRLLQTSSRTVVKYFGVLLIFAFLATLCYFSLRPFTQFTPAIYVLLFILLLVFLRRKAALVSVVTGSESH